MTSKEEEWQKCRDRVSELVASLPKSLVTKALAKKANSSQRKTSNANNEEKYSYVHFHSADK